MTLLKKDIFQKENLLCPKCKSKMIWIKDTLLCLKCNWDIAYELTVPWEKLGL